MTLSKITSTFVIVTLFVCSAVAQRNQHDREANQPVEPFKIAGNLYYVGSSDMACYLITTPAGHIVLDGGFAETAPQIEANIAKLGFNLKDVKVLLNSQAHYDHSAGFAQLKRDSGAKLEIMEGDAELIEHGGRGDFFFGDKMTFTPVKVDRVLHEGDTVAVGGMTLHAMKTAGHTKGCTSWTTTIRDGQRDLSAVFVCSESVLPGYKLVNDPKYPQQAADYEDGFKKLQAVKPDLFLGSHGVFFGLTEKRAKQKAGAKENPFIDPDGYRQWLEQSRKAFETELARQRQGKASAGN